MAGGVSKAVQILAEADARLAEISCRRDDVFVMAEARKMMRRAYDLLMAEAQSASENN